MNRAFFHAAHAALAVGLATAMAPALKAAPAHRLPPASATAPAAEVSAAPDQGVLFKPESVTTTGSVTVEGKRVDYKAIAGTIIVHPKGWDDAVTGASARRQSISDAKPDAAGNA